MFELARVQVVESTVWSLLWYISEGQYDILCPVIKALHLHWNKGEIQCKGSYF